MHPVLLRTHDIKVFFSKDCRAIIDRFPRTIENTPDHVLGNTDSQNVSTVISALRWVVAQEHACLPEFAAGRLTVDTRCALKHLDRRSTLKTRTSFRCCWPGRQLCCRGPQAPVPCVCRLQEESACRSRRTSVSGVESPE